jgi:hypothetical protein
MFSCHRMSRGMCLGGAVGCHLSRGWPGGVDRARGVGCRWRKKTDGQGVRAGRVSEDEPDGRRRKTEGWGDGGRSRSHIQSLTKN